MAENDDLSEEQVESCCVAALDMLAGRIKVASEWRIDLSREESAAVLCDWLVDKRQALLFEAVHRAGFHIS